MGAVRAIYWDARSYLHLLVEGYGLLTRVWDKNRRVFIEGLSAEEGPEPYGASDHQRYAEGEHPDADHEDATDRSESREAVLRIKQGRSSTCSLTTTAHPGASPSCQNAVEI